MKDILERIFTQYINTSENNKKYEHHIVELEEKLNKTLNEEERSILREYSDAHFDYVYNNSTENFRRGFWLGFELMRELAEIN